MFEASKISDAELHLFAFFCLFYRMRSEVENDEVRGL